MRGSFPVTELLVGPSIEELATELAGQHASPADAAASADQATAAGDDAAWSADAPERLLANIDLLTYQDVEALLGTLLTDQKGRR
jgi:hypothetical protein